MPIESWGKSGVLAYFWLKIPPLTIEIRATRALFEGLAAMLANVQAITPNT